MTKTHNPIFKAVFGDNWEKLPTVIRQRYDIKPYSEEHVSVEGVMDISRTPFIRLFSPLMRMFGVLVPYDGRDIPATVHFHSEPGNAAFCFNRVFRFPGKQPFHFRSKMFHVAEQTIIEYMRFGIGIKFRYEYDGKDTVYLRYAGYVWKLGNYVLPAPIGLLLGRGFGEEIAMTENSFRMRAGIEHFLFGVVYEYKGVFAIAETQ